MRKRVWIVFGISSNKCRYSLNQGMCVAVWSKLITKTLAFVSAGKMEFLSVPLC